MREELKIAGVVDDTQWLMTYVLYSLWKEKDSDLIYRYLTVSMFSQMMVLS